MSDTNHPRVAILGAGISGLTCAYQLKKKNPNLQITLFDQSDQVGGKMQTQIEGGYLFEMGPHSLRLNKKHHQVIFDLFKELKLYQKIIKPSKNAKKKYLLVNHKLKNFFPNPLSFFKPSNFKNLLLPLMLERKKKIPALNTHTIYDYFSQKFSPFIAKNFLDPIMVGIAGGDIKELSLKSYFPGIEKLDSKKSVIWQLLKQSKVNPSAMISFINGMQSLPTALIGHTELNLHLNEKIKKIEFSPQLKVISSSYAMSFDAIFCALPYPALQQLLIKDNHIDLLEDKISHCSYKVVHLGFDHKIKKERGFGALSPSWSSDQISGIIFDSDLYAEQNSSNEQERLTVLINDKSPLYEEEDETLILLELEKIFKKPLKPKYFKRTKISEAIPLYHLKHENKTDALKKHLKSLSNRFYLLGNYLSGASVPSCMLEAIKVADSFSLENHVAEAVGASESAATSSG